MKFNRETNKELAARLDADRLRLIDLLNEWPLEKRQSDQDGYIAAIREHYRDGEG